MEILISAAVAVLKPLYPTLTPEQLKKALEYQDKGRLLSKKEAASELNVCKATIVNLAKAGKIRVVEVCPRHEVKDGRGYTRMAGGRVGYPMEDITRLKDCDLGLIGKIV